VAQLYPQALDSIFVASYGSQGYGGNILNPLHTGWGRPSNSRSLRSLGKGPVEHDVSSTFSIVTSRIRYSGNVFIGRSLTMAIISVSIILVFQLQCRNVYSAIWFCHRYFTALSAIN
jgi:hypothetical protein